MRIAVLLLTIWVFAVSIFDIRYRRVPNWLVGLGAALACVSLVLARDIWIATPFQSLLGVTLAFIVFLPLYAFGAMGAADVKVFGVLGLWLGVNTLVPIWLWASAAAGVHAIYAITMTRFRPFTIFGRTLVIGSNDQIRGAPYAAFLALAAWGVVVSRHASQLSIF